MTYLPLRAYMDHSDDTLPADVDVVECEDALTAEDMRMWSRVPAVITTRPTAVSNAHTSYLAEMAKGYAPEQAMGIACLSPANRDKARAVDAEFRNLELLLMQCSVKGGRPELARALLSHGALGAALRLLMEMNDAKDSRDRIRSAIAVIEHGPLAQPGVDASTTALLATIAGLAKAEGVAVEVTQTARVLPRNNISNESEG